MTHEPEPPLVRAVYSFTAAEVAKAMRGAVEHYESFIPPDQINPILAGRLLGQLRLDFHRTAKVRLWSTRPADLVRLSHAYSEPLPHELAQAFAAYLAAPNPPP